MKRKGDGVYVKWKGYNNSFSSWIDKKRHYINEYFTKPRRLEGCVKVELNLSNYATKPDLKNATSVNTSELAKKVDLAGLKSAIDKLDIGKLETTPVDLSKRSDVVKMKLLKRLNIMNCLKKLMLFRLSILVL